MIAGHVTGTISDAELSFMVQDPRGIIDVFNPRSFDCRWNM